MTIDRQPGFYWVRDYQWWAIARWHEDGIWQHPGSDGEFTDVDYMEIDERRITRDEHD